MSKALDKAIVEELLAAAAAAWNEGHVDALDDVLATDFDYHAPPLAHIVGRDKFKKYVTNTRIAYPDFEVEVEGSVVQGDISVIWGTMRGTNTGVSPGTGLPATGRTIEFRSCEVARWDGRRVVELWAHNDYLTMMQQLGFVQLPRPA